MLIDFDTEYFLFYPGSDPVMDLQSAGEFVECLVRLNLIYLTRARQLNARIPRLYQSGVRYRPTDTWEAIPTLYRKRFGDCKNLASALIAELRFYDRIDALPAFRWVENADRTVDYHILVQVGNQYEDPSLKLGMNSADVARFYAAA
jgi:hypothetical protein